MDVTVGKIDNINRHVVVYAFLRYTSDHKRILTFGCATQSQAIAFMRKFAMKMKLLADYEIDAG